MMISVIIFIGVVSIFMVIFPLRILVLAFEARMLEQSQIEVNKKYGIPNEKQILQSEILRLTSELDMSRIELSKYKGYRG